MKSIRRILLGITACTLILSCAKPAEDETETCEDTNSTRVTFTNTGTNALRVVVSATLTPQFEPVNPLFSIDLAPGQSVSKEFTAGRYMASWYNCASNCTRMGHVSRDFTACNAYEEKR
ncbi:MAG TPA: hypothetical protein VHK69_02670 [Chitinophagaceae bacterium]|jgi:hypothetical protein|nr:hypothetical protein [Chitinophagaceae bacterium]